MPPMSGFVSCCLAGTATARPSHQMCLPLLLHPQVAVASVDASISGVAVELRRLSLRRSAAAAALVALMLPPPGSLNNLGSAAQAERQAAIAVAAAAAAAGSASWVDVLALEADAKHAQEAQLQHERADASQMALSLHYFDTSAAPSATRAASAGRRRCVLAVGRLLMAHAPGFATSLLLFARQYSAASSAGVWDGGRPRGASGSELPSAAASLAGTPVKQQALAAAEPPSKEQAAGSGSPSLLLQALQPGLELECRLAQFEVAALVSQAPDAAAAVLLLRQLELRR